MNHTNHQMFLLGCFHTSAARSGPEFFSESSLLRAGVKAYRTLVWTKQVNSGPPENVGLGSLANKPHGLSSEPKRESDVEHSAFWMVKKTETKTAA